MKNWQRIIVLLIIIIVCASAAWGYTVLNNKDVKCDEFSITMPHDYSVLSNTNHAISIENNKYTQSIFKIQKLNDSDTSYLLDCNVGDNVNGTQLLSSDVLNMTSDNFTNFTIQKTLQQYNNQYELYVEFDKDDNRYSITRTYDSETTFNNSVDKDLPLAIQIANSLEKR